jgi:hypothetical protein
MQLPQSVLLQLEFLLAVHKLYDFQVIGTILAQRTGVLT